tara:strand:+ start:1778 stop:2530 length:753 start_codon:yes stop_codon:yes gene_type:complete
VNICIAYKCQVPDADEGQLHARTGLPLVSLLEISKIQSDGYLYFSDGILKLQLLSLPGMTPLFVSFEGLERRAKDSLFQQSLIKAVGIGKGKRPSILDGTGGLGSDGFLMASTGCKVSLFERDKVIYELLKDGLRRYAAKDSNGKEVSKRIQIENRDFLESKTLTNRYEVVYLDPMFPMSKKRSRSKRPMLYLQEFLQAENNGDQMLSEAKRIATKRIVVKRGIRSPTLTNHDVDMVYRGNSNRFDIYLI